MNTVLTPEGYTKSSTTVLQVINTIRLTLRNDTPHCTQLASATYWWHLIQSYSGTPIQVTGAENPSTFMEQCTSPLLPPQVSSSELVQSR